MSKKKAIHFFVRSLNEKTGGGSHHNAISFIRLLRETGYEVIVHTLVSFNNQSPEDIQLIEHNGNLLGFLHAQDFLEKLLLQYEDTSVLFFLYGVDFTWGGDKYRMHGGKVPVAVFLDTYLGSMGLSEGQGIFYHIKRTLWDKFVGLRYTRHIDRFLAVSPFLQKQYIQFGFPKEKFSIVPNFFDLKKSCFGVSVKSNKLVRLLYAGRIIHDKGVDLLIQAVARLPKQYSWTLKIVGDGPTKEKCVQLIKGLGIASHIRFVPWLNAKQLAEEYSKADIFVHPARWPEPFGRTVVEAMECGVAVIVPAKGGTAWIVNDAGMIFENSNLDSLYSSIEQLVLDPILRTSLGVAGTKRAKDFSKEIAGRNLIDVVRDTISKNRAVETPVL